MELSSARHEPANLLLDAHNFDMSDHPSVLIDVIEEHIGKEMGSDLFLISNGIKVIL
jgi:hypothetical protein